MSAKERVQQELDELEEKLDKLNAFIGNEKFEGLSVDRRQLLISQSIVMETYAHILRLRLRIWDMGREQK
jgi:hypothetical protein